MRLIINIPAYNEAENIAKTIASIPRSYTGITDVKIQVIDDGSSDDTSTVAKNAGADYVVRHDVNRRLGASFHTARINALSVGADIMVNIDADGQFDPGQIQSMIDPVLSGKADMVVGDRFGDHEAQNMPWTKKFLNKFAARLVGAFLGVKTNDLTCGFRAHNRETLLRLNTPTGFTYTQETIIDAIGKNLSVVWHPVNVQYFDNRTSRVVKSIFSFVNNSIRIIIRAVRDVRPMRFFGVPGFFLIALSLVSFVVFLSLYFQEFQITPYRNHLLVSIALFLVGLQMVVLAFIADMIRTNRKLTEEVQYELRKKNYTKI
ncbi:MAG: glycosyltransferase family 2 protein [Candidatus Moranbacteria bacterium]|nr:glycosyltransferase family 2 protein [Candidatus Moranbacteria bacterium]